MVGCYLRTTKTGATIYLPLPPAALKALKANRRRFSLITSGRVKARSSRSSQLGSARSRLCLRLPRWKGILTCSITCWRSKRWKKAHWSNRWLLSSATRRQSHTSTIARRSTSPASTGKVHIENSGYKKGPRLGGLRVNLGYPSRIPFPPHMLVSAAFVWCGPLSDEGDKITMTPGSSLKSFR